MARDRLCIAGFVDQIGAEHLFTKAAGGLFAYLNVQPRRPTMPGARFSAISSRLSGRADDSRALTNKRERPSMRLRLA